MEFEWDEDKRLANIAKHGIDFLRAEILFAGLHFEEEARTVGDEKRWFATGFIGDLYATVVFTKRGNALRLISLRRARRGEREKHRQIFGGPA